MKTKKRLFSSLLILFCFYAFGGVTPEEKRVLGRTVLFDNVEYEASMSLHVCIPVDEIQIMAKKELYLNKIKLLFNNDGAENIHFYSLLSADLPTKWHQLKKTRCIQNLKIFGYSKHLTAGIIVFGRRN